MILFLVYLPGLSYQYGCQNPIKWWHFCYHWLLVVYVPTNSFHVADRSSYTNTSGCTDLIYHNDLDILWVLAWDNQTQGGQWSWCVYHILCILGQHHFVMCLLENFPLIDSGPVPLRWSPQSQISDLMKLATDGWVKNYHVETYLSILLSVH